MGNTHHYRSVSGDESAPLAEKEAQFSSGRSGWGKMSILMSVVLGGLVLTIIAGIATTLGSAAVNYTHDEAAATTTASAAAIVASSSTAAAETTPTPAATPEGDSNVDTTVDATVDPSLRIDQEIEHCGGSPDEARERGCVFDVMMQLWTPKACFDEVLSDRFLAVGNWTWYADPGAEHIFTLEEMRKGEHDAVYVAQDYHKTHCIYAWERLVRAMRNQQPLITEFISYDHVIHCRHKTLERPDGAVRGVRAPTGYTQCAPFGTWMHNLPPSDHSTTE